LIGRFNLLGDLHVTADKIGAARIKQYAEINTAVNKWLNTLAPPTVTKESAGALGVKAAKKGIRAAKDVRRKAAQKQYQEAMKVKGLDISNTITQIDEKLNVAARGSAEQRSLTKIKTMLTREVKDKEGKLIKVPEDRLEVLDKVKKNINSMWKKDPKTAPEITEQGSINKVLNSMLKKIDEEVPVYKEARQIFQKGVPAVEKLTKGKIGEIAKIEGEGVEKVAKTIFSPGRSSPQIIAKAKPVIIKQGGQYAWNALLRTHIKEAFRDVVKTGSTNIGGQLRKRLFGDLNQRDILRVAMSKQQYKNFDDLMKVFERTALTVGRESTTATRQVSLAKLEEEAKGVTGKLIRAATRPLYTYQRIGGDFMTRLRSDRYKEQLADLLLSGKAATQLQSMLRLKPGSQILLKRLSVFLTTLGGVEVRQRRVRSKYKDVYPAILTKPQLIPGEPRGWQR
jgi:hypothetical protein